MNKRYFTSSFRLNKLLFLVLVTTLLSLQWSATHIHLAGQHEHGSAKHQHQLTAHQHSIVSHHSDAIDVADNTLAHDDSNKVVELEQVCTQFHGKLGDKAAVLSFSIVSYCELPVLKQAIVTTYSHQAYQSYHQYNPLYLRAPPVIS